VSQSHLNQYLWLVLSPSQNGLFCKYCPLFVSGACGGMNKSEPLQQMVTKPLLAFSKLLGKDGYLEKHRTNQYHIDAVDSASQFLSAYDNTPVDVRNQFG